MQLYRATHEKRYLDLAKYYLDIRGLENSANRSRHNQSYKPVLEQSEAVGHAVNDASLMVSLADVGVLTGIRDYFDAAQRIWLDAVGSKYYITGGIGSTGNEGFGKPYSLPNISAYSETCAAFMFATFNHKMFLATGESRYIDVMERTMYNNAVARSIRFRRPVLLCQPAGKCRRRARPSLGKSLAGMLSAQSRQVSGVHARLYLRPEAKRRFT